MKCSECGREFRVADVIYQYFVFKGVVEDETEEAVSIEPLGYSPVASAEGELVLCESCAARMRDRSERIKLEVAGHEAEGFRNLMLGVELVEDEGEEEAAAEC